MNSQKLSLPQPSIPITFKPTKIQGKYYVDGGTYANLDVSQAVIRCQEAGVADSNIIIDIFMDN